MKDKYMPTTESHDLPLLDCEVLEELKREFHDQEAYEAHLRQNQELWPMLYERLAGAIHSDDQSTAMDAVLSLRAASQSVGALMLAAAALEVESSLRDGHLNAAKGLLDDLEVCGTATMVRLAQELPDHDVLPIDDTDWTLLAGCDVEVQFPGGAFDHGMVDAVTHDGLILWLRHDGASTRRMVEKTPGTWITCVHARGYGIPGPAGALQQSIQGRRRRFHSE